MENLLNSLSNELPTIGIIGMLGVGKTETSNAIGRLLKRGVYSVDPILVEVLKNECGLAPAAYFEKHGEEAFRRWEKEQLINNFDVPSRIVLDFGGFGSVDVGYGEMFDGLKRKDIYTVFLNSDISVSINHMKQFNPRAINPLTGEHGYEDWATRPGYVMEAKSSFNAGGTLEEGWIARHKKAESRVDFIYSKSALTLNLGDVEWSVDSHAKMVIMAVACQTIPDVSKYAELFAGWIDNQNDAAMHQVIQEAIG